MATDTNLQFIRQKLYELRNAIMYNGSSSLVKIPNNIISLVKVDEEGDVWFTAKNASANIEACDKCFPARLHFYRKGLTFFMEVSGKATIESHSYKGDDRLVLLKMNLANVEYTEPDTERKMGLIERNIVKAYQWFLQAFAVSRRERSIFPKIQESGI